MKQRESIDAFVIMPFGNAGEYREGNAESNYIYNHIISPALESVLGREGKRPNIRREFDENLTGSITDDIVRALADAEIVVADLTGRNPNVFLELGIRFSLRNRGTVLIAQHGTRPPFDVSDYRTIFYRIVQPDVAREQIEAAVRDVSSARCVSDSLVYDTFSEISVVIPDYCESFAGDRVTNANAMVWSEYWSRIGEISRLLEGPASNGQFVPDAVMGISNGGLIAADLIGRGLFRGTPIMSLWANRFTKPKGVTDESFWYFDNDYNNVLIDAIKVRTTGRSAVILLLDDHLGTGTTAAQAENYLRARFDEKVDILYIPLFSNRPEYIDVVEDLLPYRYGGGAVFAGVTPEGFLESLRTNARQFPYEKEISFGV